MSFELTNTMPSSRINDTYSDEEKAVIQCETADIAVQVSNLSKCYHIYDTPRDRLKQFIFPSLQRLTRQIPKQYFREFWALKDVSFEIKRGETVGIIGRNGSGKSTLLQMICGTLHPTNGEIGTRGRVAALLELGSGFNPEFTGHENIYMNASVLGLSIEEINHQYDQIVAFADIGEFIHQPMKTYSSGMNVRLAFAVMAHVKAEILIIDEALSVGDAFFVQKCMRFLRQFMEKGTVLFVSHDIGAVLNLCSHAIWLHEGSIEASGHPKIVTESYLEKQYESEQGRASIKTSKMPKLKIANTPLRDMRLDFINRTNLRNDIELFSFPANVQGFGGGGAEISNVRLFDSVGRHLSWVVGGEQVRLQIEFHSLQKFNNVIVGFQVKDRLGQIIFGDNSFLTYIDNPPECEIGELMIGVFDFQMPILPAGDYSIMSAVAEGTQENHAILNWIHDALVFKVHGSSICHGLIGVTMNNIAVCSANEDSNR